MCILSVHTASSVQMFRIRVRKQYFPLSIFSDSFLLYQIVLEEKPTTHVFNVANENIEMENRQLLKNSHKLNGQQITRRRTRAKITDMRILKQATQSKIKSLNSQRNFVHANDDKSSLSFWLFGLFLFSALRVSAVTPKAKIIRFFYSHCAYIECSGRTIE